MTDQVWGDQVGIVPFVQLLSTNGDGTGVDTFGVGDEAMQARWTFTKFTNGAGIWLNNGSKLVCTVNDDLDDLVAHRITCQGYKIGPGIHY